MTATPVSIADLNKNEELERRRLLSADSHVWERMGGRLDWMTEPRDGSRVTDLGADRYSSVDAMALAAYAEEIASRFEEAAGEPIAHLLGSLPGLHRTSTMLGWALSPRDALRLAVARAGSHGLDAVGLYSALDHLADDANPEVRQAARDAIARRDPARA